MDEETLRTITELMNCAAKAIDRLIKTITDDLLPAMFNLFKQKAAFEIFKELMLEDLSLYGTKRQVHLLKHSRPRTRKKWENALRRRKRLTEKRYKK